MSGGSEPLHGRRRAAVSAGLAVRAGVIAVIGLALGELPTTIAIILTYYGVLFLLGLPFLGLRWRTLAALGGTWLLVGPVVSQAVRPLLPPRGFDNPRLAGLGDPWQMVTELTFTGYYPAVPWLGYLLVGMAVGRADLRRRGTALVVLAIGIVLAAVSWLVSEALLSRPSVTRALLATAPQPDVTVEQLRRILEEGTFGTTPTGSWWWLAVHAPHSGTPFDLAHTTGTALAVLGLCLVAGRLWPRTMAVLFGAGAMTLTLYTLHVVLRTPPFLPEDDVGTFAWHVVIVLSLGAAFRLMSLRGPLETVTTALAHRAGDQVSRA
ncbi:MAG: DUF1624 domain-containing protein [Nocardioidaceae bacterium]|nr:DUF1624 domain-containing protein [Nocardioidaceae bacterium]